MVRQDGLSTRDIPALSPIARFFDLNQRTRRPKPPVSHRDFWRTEPCMAGIVARRIQAPARRTPLGTPCHLPRPPARAARRIPCPRQEPDPGAQQRLVVAEIRCPGCRPARAAAVRPGRAARRDATGGDVQGRPGQANSAAHRGPTTARRWTPCWPNWPPAAGSTGCRGRPSRGPRRRAVHRVGPDYPA